MTKINKRFFTFLKGFFIGVGAIIPGVSGGTAAILCGEFEKILYSTSNIIKSPIKSLKHLVPIGFGVLAGVLTFAFPITLFCEHCSTVSKIVFSAITLISALFFFNNKVKFTYTSKKILSMIIGLVCALLFSYVLDKSNYLGCNISNTSLLIIGIPLSLALVLPAISFSYMLLFFGLYERTIEAVINLDIIYIFYLSLGIIIGSYVFSKLLLTLIKRYSAETYSFVFGFVIFSIFDVIIR